MESTQTTQLTNHEVCDKRDAIRNSWTPAEQNRRLQDAHALQRMLMTLMTLQNESSANAAA